MHQDTGTRRCATLTALLTYRWPALPAAAVVGLALFPRLTYTIVSITRREAEDGVRPAAGSPVRSSSLSPPLVGWHIGYQMVSLGIRAHPNAPTQNDHCKTITAKRKAKHKAEKSTATHRRRVLK